MVLTALGIYTKTLSSIHLKGQAGLDLLLKNLRNRAVKVGEDLHGELGIDAMLGDEVIEGICQSGADAAAKSFCQR